MLKFLEVNIFWSFSWILLILGLILDTGLNFYKAPSPPLTVLEVKVMDFEIFKFKLKFLVKVFRSGFLLNL